MYLSQLLRANPVLALSLLVSIATILWCILLARRQRNRLDKALTGLLGLIAIYESLRILKDSGLGALARFHAMDSWIDLVSACLYLVAALILRTSSVDRSATQVQLRLVEADEKSSDMSGAIIATIPELGHPLVDSSPLAVFAVDARGGVTYCNPAAELLTGWSRIELVGHELPFDPNGPMQAKNGRLIECAVWVSPIRASHGPPRGKLIVAAGANALREAGLEFSAPDRSRSAIG